MLRAEPGAQTGERLAQQSGCLVGLPLAKSAGPLRAQSRECLAVIRPQHAALERAHLGEQGVGAGPFPLPAEGLRQLGFGHQRLLVFRPQRACERFEQAVLQRRGLRVPPLFPVDHGELFLREQGIAVVLPLYSAAHRQILLQERSGFCEPPLRGERGGQPIDGIERPHRLGSEHPQQSGPRLPEDRLRLLILPPGLVSPTEGEEDVERVGVLGAQHPAPDLADLEGGRLRLSISPQHCVDGHHVAQRAERPRVLAAQHTPFERQELADEGCGLSVPPAVDEEHGEAAHGGDRVGVVGSERPPLRLQRLPVERLRCIELVGHGVDTGQEHHGSQRLAVLRSEDPAPLLQRAGKRGVRLVPLALGVKGLPEVDEGAQRVGMLRSEHALLPCERVSEQRFGFGVLALQIIEGRKTRRRRQGLRVLWAQR